MCTLREFSIHSKASIILGNHYQPQSSPPRFEMSSLNFRDYELIFADSLLIKTSQSNFGFLCLFSSPTSFHQKRRLPITTAEVTRPKFAAPRSRNQVWSLTKIKFVDFFMICIKANIASQGRSFFFFYQFP